MVIQGLERHGYHETAQHIKEKTLHFVTKYYYAYGVLFEFYDAKDLVPPVACDRKGRHRSPYDIRVKMDSIRDYHWTAALVADMLLQKGIY
jgi:neutral trehalase